MSFPFPSSIAFDSFAPKTRSLMPRGVDSPERFYLSGISLNNWGTFENLTHFAISRKGFVFAGPSGSGKSTALDAHATLMTPPRWLDFNVAARSEKGQDRTLITYVRGAWGNKTGGGSEITRQYLRSDATWSAISETYRNDLGHVLTLVQVFWLKSKSCQMSDLNRRYFVFERDFELTELQPFLDSGFDRREAEKIWPDTPCIDTFDRYQESFRSRLGILNESTLRLLHKTQSTKDMGDLNKFLRDFMLTEPGTFKVADELAKSFYELNAAHETVKEAEAQAQVLSPVREHGLNLEGINASMKELTVTTEALEPFVLQTQKALQEAQAKLTGQSIETATIKAEGARKAYKQATEAWGDLRDQQRNIGGGELQRLESQIEEAIGHQTNRGRRMKDFQALCIAIGMANDSTPENFIEVQNKANELMSSIKAASSGRKDERGELVVKRTRATDDIQAIQKELNSLSSQKSNLPYALLEIRAKMALELDIDIARLPFGGEMIQVKQSEALWQGAIERLLGGFGVTLHVDQNDLPKVTAWVNNRHLGQKLTIQLMRQQSVGTSPSSRAAVHKLDFAKGPHEAWFRENMKLVSNYECVDSEEELRKCVYGLTKEGLIRDGHTRFRKDDRRDVNDRKNWVLGFSNEGKISEYQRLGQQAVAKFNEAVSAIEHLDAADGDSMSIIEHCKTLSGMRWDDIDVMAYIEKVRMDTERLAQLKDQHPDLELMKEKIAKAEIAKNTAMGEESTRNAALALAQAKLESIEKLIAEICQKHSDKLDPELVAPAQTNLDRLFALSLSARSAEVMNLENIEPVTRAVLNELNVQRRTLEKRQGDNEYGMLSAMSKFIDKWPMEAQDLDSNLASAEEFIVKLEKLEEDKLPEFIGRFDKLLRDQSDQYLTSLMRQLRSEVSSIKERIDQVNDALEKTEFNPGTTLKIDVKDRGLPDVNEFKMTIRGILEQSIGVDRASDEVRFLALKKLVGRLDSKEPHELRWRNLVLDVRQHNNFLAVERAGKDEIQTYGDSSGQSGGERQKLTLTILAAALRYQLGGDDGEFPTYSTITIDEAFDKADPEFTKTTMRIFEGCGFQMVVATPLKAVIALDEFVGGAVFIHKGANHISKHKPIQYDEVKKRLILDRDIIATNEAIEEDQQS